MRIEDQDLVRAYRLFFNSPSGEAVVRDLMKFCSFRKEVTNEIDEGKRRVFLRILQLSQLSDDQLLSLFAGQSMKTERQDD